MELSWVNVHIPEHLRKIEGGEVGDYDKVKHEAEKVGLTLSKAKYMLAGSITNCRASLDSSVAMR